MLRIILFISNAGAAIACVGGLIDARRGTIQLHMLPIAILALLLLMNVVFLGPPAKRPKDSQILRIIKLWLGSKEGELERRREKVEKTN
jgi:hypothetical protein